MILALYGHPNTGKTTTLRKLVLEFLESPKVEEDIQVGFLYYKKNKTKPTKIVVSTAKDTRVNVDFYTELMAQTLILVTTKRIKDQTGEINVVAELVRKGDADPEQEEIDNELELEIKKLISSIAQEETSTLPLFLQRLLKSDIVEGDIQISFRYKGRKIVISTAGDRVCEVEESTRLFQKVEADILVTATRNIGATHTCLSLRNYGEMINSEAIWISKCGSGSLNEARAKELHTFINLIIDNWDSEPKK